MSALMPEMISSRPLEHYAHAQALHPDIEPDDDWKNALHRQIEDGLRPLVEDARRERNAKLEQAVVDEATRNDISRKHNEVMSSIRALAATQFKENLNKERRLRMWSHGFNPGDEFDEALVKEQQSILDNIQKDKGDDSQPARSRTNRHHQPTSRPSSIKSDRDSTYSYTRSRKDSDNASQHDITDHPPRWTHQPYFTDEPTEFFFSGPSQRPIPRQQPSYVPTDVVGPNTVRRPSASSPPKMKSIPEIWKPHTEQQDTTKPYTLPRRGSSASTGSASTAASHRPAAQSQISVDNNNTDDDPYPPPTAASPVTPTRPQNPPPIAFNNRSISNKRSFIRPPDDSGSRPPPSSAGGSNNNRPATVRPADEPVIINNRPPPPASTSSYGTGSRPQTVPATPSSSSYANSTSSRPPATPPTGTSSRGHGSNTGSRPPPLTLSPAAATSTQVHPSSANNRQRPVSSSPPSGTTATYVNHQQRPIANKRSFMGDMDNSGGLPTPPHSAPPTSLVNKRSFTTAAPAESARYVSPSSPSKSSARGTVSWTPTTDSGLFGREETITGRQWQSTPLKSPFTNQVYNPSEGLGTTRPLVSDYESSEPSEGEGEDESSSSSSSSSADEEGEREAKLLEEMKRKEEESKEREAEAVRKEEEARRTAEAAKLKEEEAKRIAEEARKKEEEAIRIAEEARKKEEAARQKEEEASKKEEEARKKEEEIRLREEEVKRREDVLNRREAEARQREEEARKKRGEEERRRQHQEEARKRAEERKRKDSSTAATSSSPPEREWARRQAELAKEQQERFRREQERLEWERQAKEAATGRISTKEEIGQLFATHERMWERLATQEELTWDSFPWPVLRRVTRPEELNDTSICAYMTAQGKERIKEQLRRWHPDRFDTRLLPKVVTRDRLAVKSGADSVARGLTNLLMSEV